VAMMNAVLGQAVPSAGEGVHLAAHDGVAGVPVEREVRRLDRFEDLCSFTARRRIAGKLVLDHEQQALLSYNLRGGAKLFIDGRAVRSDIFQPPEVEAANLVGAELLCQRDAALDNFILMLVGHFVRSVHIGFRAVTRLRSAGPIDFEERARDVGDLELVLGEDLLRVCDFSVRRSLQVLAPNLANLDPLQAEISSEITEILKGDFDACAMPRNGLVAQATAVSPAAARKLRLETASMILPVSFVALADSCSMKNALVTHYMR
jgi:hypothetical protein